MMVLKKIMEARIGMDNISELKPKTVFSSNGGCYAHESVSIHMVGRKFDSSMSKVGMAM